MVTDSEIKSLLDELLSGNLYLRNYRKVGDKFVFDRTTFLRPDKRKDARTWREKEFVKSSGGRGRPPSNFSPIRVAGVSFSSVRLAAEHFGVTTEEIREWKKLEKKNK